MTSALPLPYFDFLLAFLAQNNLSVEKSFGRHVHWGYWPDPAGAVCDDDDFACAAEQLTVELCRMAEITSGETVLDVGCGFGGTLASLNERHSHMRLNGLNLDGRQLERARQLVQPANSNTLEFHQGDACELPYLDRTFDRVLAVECIFHFPSRERFFAEAYRVLAPGGTLALSDFVPSALFLPIARVATESSVLARFQYFGHCNLSATIGLYRRLAAQTGFDLLGVRNITRHTLPTYTYLRNLLRHAVLVEGITERIANVVGILKVIAALGLLNYYLLAFRKPANPQPAAPEPWPKPG